MSIADEISRLTAAKADLKTAIEGKGVTVPEGTTLDGYAALVESISGGGSGGGGSATGDYRVRFLDYEGTVLLDTWVDSGGSVTPPADPSHEGLVFQGWNYDNTAFSNITRDMDIGAMYITDDGKTRLKIKVWDTLRASVPLYFSQTVANGVTIDWGDASATETVSGTGNLNITHTYSAAGEYTITLTVAQGCTLGLGNGANRTTVIGGSQRGYANLLQAVQIGSGVTGIGNYTFSKCSSLASVSIPDGVTSIGAQAFEYCAHLTNLVIPSGVAGIGIYVLSYCYSLASVSLPSSMTNFEDGVFSCCSSLTSVSIPDGVTSIGDYAFYGCYCFKSINIPSSVTSIGNYAFEYCSFILSINIPEDVTSIGINTFYNCSSLASVSIPDGVTSIGAQAFAYCSFVKEYHLLPTTPPTLANTNAFTNIASDCVIYVPAASLSAYQTAANWSTYASKMQGE